MRRPSFKPSKRKVGSKSIASLLQIVPTRNARIVIATGAGLMVCTDKTGYPGEARQNHHGTSDSQAIQRTLQPAAAHAQDVGINHSRGDILMAKQFLDRPYAWDWE